jgi:TetR/AcrR family transcriptional regulator, regulator of autoinduction and epiphytic fitness
VGANEQTARRAYQSSQREAQTRQTRRRILGSATTLFLDRGYAGTTMRAIATDAHVALPTVELLFRTKAGVLKAAIDVAIAGDHESIAVLDRDWTRTALLASTADEFLAIVASIVGPAQERSGGLVLALFEGSATDSELADLAVQMINQRAQTAAWLVAVLKQKAFLREDCTENEAIDTVWILMDPAVFDRLIRQRRWSREHYQDWFANGLQRLLIKDSASQTASTTRRRKSR